MSSPASRTTFPLAGRSQRRTLALFAAALAVTLAALFLQSGAVAMLWPFVVLYVAGAVLSWLAGWRAGVLLAAVTALLANVFFVGAPGRFEGAREGLLASLISFGAGAGVALLSSSLRRALERSERVAAALRRRERSQRAGKEWFQSLVESIPQMVWVSDTRGTNTYNNRRLLDYVGTTSQQLAGQGWAQLIHPEDRARAVSEWTRMVHERGELASEVRVRRHDGEYRWFSAAAAPLRDASGGLVGWIGTWSDIHDRRLLEDALREAGRRKDEFLGVLSHELRNPLTPIRNSVYLLARSPVRDPLCRRAATVIERQVVHLTRLVEDLLDVTRISRGKIRLQPSHVDLAALVRRTVEDQQSLLSDHQVVVSTPETPVWADVDEARIAQVLYNLLTNAVKFTPAGGRIEVGLAPEASQALLTVADTGIGIEPEMRARLFEPFAQAESTLARTRGGLGLGLALVKGLTEQHGGQVAVWSEGAGRGARFEVRLPLRCAHGVRPGPAPAPPGLKPSPRRVLIIEDNVDVADSLRDVLAAAGHQVSVAYSGTAGIDAARSLRPQVVLCDIGLPALDGYAVAQALRHDPATASSLLVALTGYTQAADRLRSREAGFDQHVGKPPDLDQLQRLILQAPPGPEPRGPSQPVLH